MFADLKGSRACNNLPDTRPQEFAVTTARPDIVLIKNTQWHSSCITCTVPFRSLEAIINALQEKQRKQNDQLVISTFDCKGIKPSLTTLRDQSPRSFSHIIPQGIEEKFIFLVFGTYKEKSKDFCWVRLASLLSPARPGGLVLEKRGGGGENGTMTKLFWRQTWILLSRMSFFVLSYYNLAKPLTDTLSTQEPCSPRAPLLCSLFCFCFCLPLLQKKYKSWFGLAVNIELWTRLLNRVIDLATGIL